MKNKKGFVFVETMIVVVVLVSILLIIYSSYASLISLERRQARYDEPLFIYRTHVVGKFLISLNDNEGNSIIGNKINESSNNSSNFIRIAPEDADLFNENYENSNSLKNDFFSSLYNNFHIQNIFLISGNQLENIKEEEVSSDFYRYLKSIDTSENIDQVFLVIEYAEKVNGTQCDPSDLYDKKKNQDSTTINGNQENSCTFYYASLKINKEEAV